MQNQRDKIKSDKNMHEPRFDRQCTDAKNVIRKLEKDLKKDPNSWALISVTK